MKNITILLFLIFAISINVNSQDYNQRLKILASDAQASDRFGISVSISGNYAVVGALYEDAGGSNAGAVYFYERNGGTWTEMQKVTASDAEAGDQFGVSVSISGNYAVVGALYEDAGGSEAGAAYFFELSSGTWTEMQKVTASDAQAYDRFGYSVSISGNYAVVGAYLEDAGGSEAGAAYFFELSSGTWTETNKVTASDAQASDYFGYSVSISGNYAVVGAYIEDAGGANAGAAYFFELSSGTWTQMNKVTASDAQANDWFGYSVSISGNYAVVGAYAEDAGGSNAGAAYFFELSSGTWTQMNKVTASDAQAGDRFGVSVSISGNYAVVGAFLEDAGGSNAGAVYFFELSTPPQEHTATFTLARNEITQLVFNIESLTSVAADGYIILYKLGSSFTGVPADGGNYSVGTAIGDATVGAIITDANALEATVANLTKQTEYHFKIYPFNWDGSDITTAAYKTDGTVPSLTVVTVPTLGEWGMIAFIGFMAIGGFVYMRRRIA